MIPTLFGDIKQLRVSKDDFLVKHCNGRDAISHMKSHQLEPQLENRHHASLLGRRFVATETEEGEKPSPFPLNHIRRKERLETAIKIVIDESNSGRPITPTGVTPNPLLRHRRDQGRGNPRALVRRFPLPADIGILSLAITNPVLRSSIRLMEYQSDDSLGSIGRRTKESRRVPPPLSDVVPSLRYSTHQASHMEPVAPVPPPSPHPQISATRLDFLLLAAVESSNFHLVRSALAEGADPRARKTVVLKVEVDGEGLRERKDVREGESALALAIKARDIDVIRELLDAGADPSENISWPLPAFYPRWSLSLWYSSRWERSPQYYNTLDLALASSAWYNLSGAYVEIDTPRTVFETREGVVVEPCPDIVTELLLRNVPVTNSALRRARELAFGASHGSTRIYILDMIERALGVERENVGNVDHATCLTPVHPHTSLSPKHPTSPHTIERGRTLAPPTPPASPRPRRRSFLVPSSWFQQHSPKASAAVDAIHSNSPPPSPKSPGRSERRRISWLAPSTWFPSSRSPSSSPSRGGLPQPTSSRSSSTVPAAAPATLGRRSPRPVTPLRSQSAPRATPLPDDTHEWVRVASPVPRSLHASRGRSTVMGLEEGVHTAWVAGQGHGAGGGKVAVQLQREASPVDHSVSFAKRFEEFRRVGTPE
ncbi:hypothetical protein M427DRAFT_47354 [Gonapodya prolifera JEL478]|uniref:Uncharacterized protein n=1 Tax=Gonapodya prolifera (strain JEL478) TaxID=1344416 RepID=A0A139A359_GONPJ|nr:hypothetical protein M427DRAFT_47354 [Gonapodya prolifera JEL478]|eukprot:KXS11144.1 hypothetical protein M427DRAFT_47354 [Gonapodya prolifera JEL478]